MSARPTLQEMRSRPQDDFIELRRAARQDVSFRAEMRAGDAAGLKIHIVDISELGFRARCDNCPQSGSIQVELPGLGFISARIVWSLGGRIGGEFARPLEPALYHKMLYSAPHQSPWHD